MSVNNNRSYHSRYYQDGQGSQTSSHSSSTRTRSSVRGGGGTRQRHYGEPRRGNYHVVHQSSSTSPSTSSSASHILRMQNYSLPSPSLRMGEGSLHMFSTLDHDLTEMFCQAILSCEKELIVRVFVMDSPKILEAIKNKVVEGVSANLSFHQIYQEEDSARVKQLSESNRNLSLHEYETVAGSKYHKKTVLMDGQRIFLGTGNLTVASLEKDVNIFVEIYSPHLYELIANEVEGSCRIGMETVTYYPIKRNKKLAKQNILKIIRQAKNTIKIAMFILSYEKILSALKYAKKRGVQVQIVVDKNNQPGKELPRELDVLEWTGTGVLHCKVCLVDGDKLFLGSPNWTTGGFCLNCEELIFIQNLTQRHQDVFQRLWETIIASTQPMQSPSQASSSPPSLPSASLAEEDLEEEDEVEAAAISDVACESNLDPNAAEFVPSWMK
ncbi:phospholipase D-like domain-containing protein [Chlamydia pecorum]|uniref:phospholipase D-like domain-containing protein n=1 Tax=Chlamydia pecorum TaxID=85991 RepID=UPI0038906F0E